jgi:hypothetical protein
MNGNRYNQQHGKELQAAITDSLRQGSVYSINLKSLG